MKCPSCKGLGCIWTGIEFYGERETLACPDCKGKGEVADESGAYGTDCRNGCDV